ncbi:major facilitator superfamily domain-containing protein [Ditylenchus destructor]|uniref:Major facilitator superfamily domain-containing protein n=1 Tax=Ditylenchus destructor TaxID=166010 RepID=A0AAD4N4A8_9BILA|nr:major facilitator superfamily domain-containing protein [Ditylenchus destructor]
MATSERKKSGNLSYRTQPSVTNSSEFNEYTPLLSTSSLPSVLTDPGPAGASAGEDDARRSDARDDIIGGSVEDFPEPCTNFGEMFPCTSQSLVDGRHRRRSRRRMGHDARHSSRGRSKKRRRTHSETDLRKMRPFIASPFMPTLATQVSVGGSTTAAENRRRATTSTGANVTDGVTPGVNNHVAPAGPVKVVGQARYGALPLKKIPADRPAVETVEELESTTDDEESEDEESGSSSSSSSASSSYTRFSDLTKKQWATVGMLAVANLCSTVAFSCIAPFYPGEAQTKGMNTSEIGIVFGVFELVMFVTAPLLGKYMGFFGSKRMFSVGLLVTGVTAIAFGFLNLLPAGRAFFWASFTIRCCEALGDACFVTSSFAISAKCFPGRIATIVGIMETFAGLGYTAGPVIGGVLYEYGGFQLPFLVLGTLLIFATALSYYLVEEIDDEPSEDAMGMLSMLKIPVIWIMVFAVIICAISLSFFDPTLADHLSSFKLSTTMVGLMFLLCGGIYTATAPLWGLLLDKWSCSNYLMLFGSTATIFSMIFVGPSPLFNIEKNLFLIGISLAVLGVAAGALYIPTFQNCLDAVKENGYDDSFQTYGCVSGVFQSAFAFGAFIGPTLGGASVQAIGFPWTTTIIAGINLAFVITLLFLIALKKCCTITISPRSKEDNSSSQA